MASFHDVMRILDIKDRLLLPILLALDPIITPPTTTQDVQLEIESNDSIENAKIDVIEKVGCLGIGCI